MSNLQKMYKVLPRERLIKYGAETLADYELIAIILNSGTQNNNVIDLSYEVLNSAGGLDNLLESSLEELKAVRGIGQVRAIKIKAILELIRRYKSSAVVKKHNINCPENLFNYFVKQYQNEKQEHLVVCALDTKNYIIETKVIFKGTINSIKIHGREIFNFAIKNLASKIILMHNHPSGSIKPSTEDIHVTKELIKISKIVDIEIIDHVIIGQKDYFSMRHSTTLFK